MEKMWPSVVNKKARALLIFGPFSFAEDSQFVFIDLRTYRSKLTIGNVSSLRRWSTFDATYFSTVAI